MFIETNNLHKDIGYLRVGVPVEIYYPYDSSYSVVKMQSPCDCSTIYDDKVNSRIKIVYNPKPVPKHMKDDGKNSYITDKVFTIYYKHEVDGQIQEGNIQISFSGVVSEVPY